MQNQLKEGGKVATRAEKIARLKSDDSRQQKIARLRASDADAMSHDDIVNQINPEPPMKRKQPPMKSDKKPYDGFQFSEMVGNVPSSAMQLAHDVVTPFMHPVDTYNAMDNLTQGVYSKLTGKGTTKEKYADAVYDALVGRYGSREKALASLERDPVGVVSDVMSVITGGAMTAAKSARLADATKIAAGAEKVADVASKLEPINVAVNTAGKARKKFQGRNANPVEDMLEALKLSTTLDDRFGSGTRESIANTILRGGYTLDADGISRLESDLHKAGLDIEAVLNNPAALEKVISPQVLQKPIDELIAIETAPQKLQANQSQAAIDSAITPYMNRMYEEGYPLQSAAEMNVTKRDAQRKANYGDGSTAVDDLTSDANKVIAREAARQVESVIPEIKIPNQQWGEAAEALPPFRRSVARLGNNQKRGWMQSFLKGVAGFGVGASAFDGVGGGLLGLGIAKTMMPNAPKGIELGAKAIEDFNLQSTPYADLYKDRSRTSNLVSGLLQSYRNTEAQRELMIEEERRRGKPAGLLGF